MKLKKGYIMKELAGRYVVLPVGGEPEGFQGMIQMNVTRIFMGMSLRREDKTGIDRSVFGEI